jgi:hypothetical protein
MHVPSPEARAWREYRRFERPLVEHVNAVILQIARCDDEAENALPASVLIARGVVGPTHQ